MQKFVQVLRRKEARVGDYVQGLNHVNLIVLDNVHRISTSPVEDFYWHFFRPPLKKALYESGFREVFLVTVLERERWVYMPLKLLLLLASMYMFAKIAADFPVDSETAPSGESSDSKRDFMLTFAAYMRSKSDKIRVRDDNGQIEVVFGNSGVVLEDKRIVVRDHNDYPYRDDAQIVGEGEAAMFSSIEFLGKETEALENYKFSTGLAYDLKGKLRF